MYFFLADWRSLYFSIWVPSLQIAGYLDAVTEYLTPFIPSWKHGWTSLRAGSPCCQRGSHLSFQATGQCSSLMIISFICSKKNLFHIFVANIQFADRYFQSCTMNESAGMSSGKTKVFERASRGFVGEGVFCGCSWTSKQGPENGQLAAEMAHSTSCSNELSDAIEGPVWAEDLCI